MPSTTGALELRVLYEISRIIGQALDLDRTLDSVLTILADEMAMQRATVTLLDTSGQLAIRASTGLSSEERERGVYQLDEGVTGRIFSTAEPFVVPDIAKEPLFLNKTQSRSFAKGKLSFLGVPIVYGEQPVGVLTVDRLFGEDVSFEEDIRFLTIVATLIGQFYGLAKQVEEREEKLKRENVSLKSRLSKDKGRFIVGKSPAMGRVRQMIEKVAPTKATVLLLGESGTGKTLTARLIHDLSDREHFPFIKVNCAAIPENLLESELFGHEKGAFTGATAPKAGRIEEADKGTIFLDEIGELTLGIQAKLLRFLQERDFERLGSTKTRKVDVRIIAATNRDLAEAVRLGDYREDLFYRLNVFPLRVPPLRERPEDITPLLNHFLDKMDKEYGRRLTLKQSALEAMLDYSWPGNVREMENLVERLAIMVEDPAVGLEDIPPHFFIGGEVSSRPEAYGGPASSAVGAPGVLGAAGAEGSSLQEMEKREVLSALERHGWIQSRAAKELGITLRQMGYRIKKFGLEDFVREKRGRPAAG